MPKVSSVKFKIKGEPKEFPIHYLKQVKFYIKDFPDEVRRIVWASTSDFNRGSKKFETEQELIDYYKNLIDRYHDIISQTRKVIAYHISAPSRFKELPKVTREIKEKLGYAGDGENEFGFTIDYSIFLQRIGDGSAFFEVLPDGSAGRNANFAFNQSTIIEYTPEREVFLQNMKQKMQDMFLKVISVMMDEKKFTAIIDNGIKLLS